MKKANSKLHNNNFYRKDDPSIFIIYTFNNMAEKWGVVNLESSHAAPHCP